MFSKIFFKNHSERQTPLLSSLITFFSFTLGNIEDSDKKEDIVDIIQNRQTISTYQEL